MGQETYVITFDTTHAAMAASASLSAAKMRFETIPTPTAISAGCGMALRFRADDPREVLERMFGTPPQTNAATLYRQVAAGEFVRDGALGEGSG